MSFPLKKEPRTLVLGSPECKALEEQTLKAFTKARTHLVLDEPFFGSLALKLEPKIAWFVQTTKGLQPMNTAATDGKSIYLNPIFFMEICSEPQRKGLIAHEVMHCFPAGTVIAGSDRPIEALQIGDRVIGRNGKHQRIVERSARHYNGALVTVKARGLLPIEVTTEHPILVTQPKWVDGGTLPRTNIREWSKPEWKTAASVTTEDWVFVPKVIGHDCTERVTFPKGGNEWSVKQPPEGIVLDEEFAEFLGWYVAEGWTTDNASGVTVGLSLAAHERPIAERLARLTAERTGSSPRIYAHGQNGIDLKFISARLGRFLKDACGAGAHNKRIPSFILYHRDESLLRAFLRGYVAGDGFIGQFVSFGTVSHTLAAQLQLAFARLGVLVNLYERAGKTTTIRGNKVNGGLIYIGQSRNQRVFDALGVTRKTKRPTSHFGELDGALLTPVLAVSQREWSGKVYNFETEDHTYVAGNIVTHNCAMGHMWRGGARDPQRFNIACDFAIDPIIKEAKMELPIGEHVNPAWIGFTAEEIYPLVEEQQKKDKGDGEAPLDGDIIPGDGQADAGELESDWKIATIEAAKIAKQIGKLPGQLERLVGKLAKGKVDWRALLRKFVQQSAKADYSWRKPNPRYAAMGVYMPVLYSETMPPMVVQIDTSGSIGGDELQAFNNEVSSILQEMRPEMTYVYWTDSRVAHVQEIPPEDDWVPEPRGGGGTDMGEGIRKAEADGIEPCCMVTITDGHTPWPDQAPSFPHLTVCTTDQVCPFGDTVKLDL